MGGRALQHALGDLPRRLRDLEALGAEALQGGLERRARDDTAQHALVLVGLQAVDLRLAAEAVPDRQHGAGDQVERAVAELRRAGDLLVPQRPGVFGGQGLPVVLADPVAIDELIVGRRGQAHLAGDAPVLVGLVARPGHREDVPAAGVLDEGVRLLPVGLVAAGEGLVEADRTVAGLGVQVDVLGLGTRARVGEDGLLAHLADLVGLVGLDAGVQRPGCGGLRDHVVQPLAESVEHAVLMVDLERQHAVQELRHLRQVGQHRTVLVAQLQPHARLEVRHRDALDLVRRNILEEVDQRVPGLGALEVVAHAEHALVAGPPLALGERAELAEPPRDRGDEPLLALQVGGDEVEDRRAGLAGAMRAAEALHRLVGAPAALHQVVRAARGLAARADRGVVAAAGAARLGEHQDRLLARLEEIGVGDVGLRAALLDRRHHPAGGFSLRTTRWPRPVTSATLSAPKWLSRISSGPSGTLRLPSSSSSRSRAASACRLRIGLPLLSTAGRERRLPLSST
jgi:hypothetical protein